MRRVITLVCGVLLFTALQQSSFAHSVGHKANPALGSSVAFAPNGELWLLATNAQGQLFIQRSGDAGQTWQAPQVLAQADKPLSADGENHPKLAFGRDGVVVIAYNRPLAAQYSGEVRVMRSNDGGQTFSAPFTLHQDRQAITHRFEAMQFDNAGRLHVAWLDQRDAHAANQGKPREARPYTGLAVYRAWSADGGQTFSPEQKVADHSCECCRIALSPAPDGGVAALWRHVFAGQRDHAFSTWQDSAAARPVVRATEDQWVLNACPHHGPSLTPAQDGGYHAVWFGQRAGEIGVRYGRLTTQGQPTGAVQTLPDAAAEHASVVAVGNKVAIVWRSFDGQANVLKAWVSHDNGHTFTQKTLARTPAANDFPRLASHAQQAYAVWRTRSETTEKIYVHALF